MGAACDEDDLCGPDLVCFEAHCTAPRANGASCTTPGQCASQACIDGVCGPVQWALVEGQACNPWNRLCRPDLLCDDGVCKDSLVPLGGACGTADVPDTYCGLGLYCSTGCFPGPCNESPTCRALPEAGQPCNENATCAPSATCTNFTPGGSTSLCVKLGAEGEACPCADELTCVNDLCAPFGATACP